MDNVGTRFYDEIRNLQYEMEKPGKLNVKGPIQSKEDFHVYDIPMEFEGFSITSIEDEAFSGCAEIDIS